ncbi:MAG: Tol-Pal system beta propeller repeat protein TolB [Desulfobacteraceae bacterium]|jgi:TolB protein
MIEKTMRSCAIVLFAAAFFLMSKPLSAEIKYFDLTSPFLRKMPMAIPVFTSATANPAENGQVRAFADELQEMLDFSGYFKMLDRASFLHDPQTSGITQATVNFRNWTAIGAELLVTGRLQVQGNAMAVELRLFDTFKSKLLIGKRYRGKLEDRRAMTKRFCAEVLLALTGRPGFFQSRLAFVSNGSGHKEIYQCEFDGKNVRQVTKKGSISSFPAWSSNGRYLAYTSFVRGPVQIFIRDLRTGTENSVRYKGVQIAPSWAPDRLELTATLSHGGDQEIYLLTGKGKMIKRLTNSRGIDVDASWSPDGKKIAFVSKRSGSPQIYIKELKTGRVERLTFEGRYNTQPSWSPKGNMIAYSSMAQGEINIFIIDVEGKNPIQLTHNQGDNEAPTWSPDGSLITYSTTREGRSRIYVMTAFGTDQRRLLTLPGEQFHPKWSQNIPQYRNN